MVLEELSQILWTQRQLLDLLQFKLEEQRLLVAHGRTRWLTLAADEVERVRGDLRHVELVRSLVVDDVAIELGVPRGAPLRDLAAAAPPPWDDILSQHRDALVREVHAVPAPVRSRALADFLA